MTRSALEENESGTSAQDADEELTPGWHGERILFARPIAPTISSETSASASQSGAAVLEEQEADAKTRAVTEALTHLGEQADAHEVAEEIECHSGWKIDALEVEAIIARLRAQTLQAPGPDQPPPENAR